MKAWRLAAAVTVALSGAIALSGAAGATAQGKWHGHGHGHAYTCDGSAGGVIPAGFYENIVVTGVCYMPSGHITIGHDLVVAPGALLDAVTPGDPSGTHVLPASVHIGGNVWVGKGAALLLGCSPNISCGAPNPGITFDEISGNVTAIGAQGVVLHSVAIGGDVKVIGGGGGTAGQTCASQMPTGPTNTALAPWSLDANLDFTPVYTDLEDSTVGGDYKVIGLNSCWLGSLRNWIGGDAKFVGNTFGDPDAMEIGNNLIWGDLGCWKNSPAPQFGEGAAPEIVKGWAGGQCSFDTVLQNPSAEGITAMGKTGVGISEHFVVSLHSLMKSKGTRTTTTVSSLPGYPITTSAGDSIGAVLSDFTLTGSGLTGTANYTGGPPGQAPGDAALTTKYASGWTHGVYYDACASCTFDGQTGLFSARYYVTQSPSGNASGFFLVTSSGTILPSSSNPVPPLATLVGWGTFSGTGSSLTLTEHLGFG